MARLMDIRLIEADPGRVVFDAAPADFHYNFSGGVHGGFAATLLDSAMACAIYTTLDAGQNCPTLELKVNYVKAITRRAGPVRGIGTVLHRGRTTALAEGRRRDRWRRAARARHDDVPHRPHRHAGTRRHQRRVG